MQACCYFWCTMHLLPFCILWFSFGLEALVSARKFWLIIWRSFWGGSRAGSCLLACKFHEETKCSGCLDQHHTWIRLFEAGGVWKLGEHLWWNWGKLWLMICLVKERGRAEREGRNGGGLTSPCFDVWIQNRRNSLHVWELNKIEGRDKL